MLANARREPGRLETAIPEGWMQGRTCYGGLSTALAYEAARTVADDLPPLRGIQIAFIGPVHGTPLATARIERRGRNATWVRAELHCEGALALAATFVFMGPVDSAVSVREMPVPDGLVPLEDASPMPVRGPTFVANFDRRRAVETDRLTPSICCWVRLKEREGLDPFTELLATADAMPPAARTLMTPHAPVSSMIWQVGLLTPLPQSPAGWWLLRSAADHVEQGACVQSMKIWNSAGEPITSGTQTIALFG